MTQYQTFLSATLSTVADLKRRVFSVLAGSLTLLSAMALNATGIPFTVKQSIEMARPVNFSEEWYRSDPESGAALPSPNGKYSILEVRKGDVARNKTIDRILMYRTANLNDYLKRRSEGAAPNPVVLGEFAVKDDWGFISHLRWINDAEIAFLAQRDEGPSQVYSINVETLAHKQLTNSATPVSGFDIGEDTILYYAYILDGQKDVEPVGNTEVAEVVNDDPLRSYLYRTYPKLNLYAASLKTGAVNKIKAPPVRLARRFQKIWISPKGRFAITLAPAVNAPNYWSQYRIPLYDFFGYTPDRVIEDPTSLALTLRLRYQLIDLTNQAVRPLLDAPAGTTAAYYAPHKAFWNDGDSSVVVTNTWLPLTPELDPAERERRVGSPADVEVHIESGRVVSIATEPAPPSGEAPGRVPAIDAAPVFLIDWDAHRKRLTRIKRRDQAIIREAFHKQDGVWERIRDTDSHASKTPTISVYQSLNERPRVRVNGGACRCRKHLLDLNPLADKFLFGHVEALNWVDSNGLKWRGGVVYPVNYIRGRTYPLILQTHGFQDTEYLTDGPYGATTAFAAQAFSNAGFVVLQVQDNRSAETLDERMDALYAEGFRSGIQQLIDRGVADNEKIGAIGWSRSGLSVLHLITAYPGLIDAATISDALLPGYTARILNVNISRDDAIQQDRINGAPLTLENANEWPARQPLYRLSDTHIPFRLEAIGADSLLHMWEFYALLKYSGKPVDYVYYPNGSHSLVKPSERMESQGGNVDWFRFWLLGEKDPSESKVTQYARWSKLEREMTKRAASIPPSSAGAN